MHTLSAFSTFKYLLRCLKTLFYVLTTVQQIGVFNRIQYLSPSRYCNNIILYAFSYVFYLIFHASETVGKKGEHFQINFQYIFVVRRPRNFGECFAFRINKRKSRLNRTVYIVLYTVHYIRISFPFCESLICIILLSQTGTIPNFQSREFFNGYDSRKLNPPQPKSRSDYPNFLTII